MTESLSIPLAPPAGMFDLLPPEASARAALSSTLIRLFERWGYQLTITPPFEHAEVIERGRGVLDHRELLRFVDPSTGEVALLRPDITPQIARIVATRLADRPAPFRLCYSAGVIRQRRGRARKQRVLTQAGVEHIGRSGIDADVEVIRLAARALTEAGLERFRVELSLVGLAREALARVSPARRADVEIALGRKDAAALRGLLASEPRVAQRALQGAVALYGDPAEVLREARGVFGAHPALRALREIVGRLGGDLPLDVDLGEVRGASYYTGVSFTLLAEGPGEPVGSGGRYDGLMARFGKPMPATGFGLDLSNLEWALDTAGRGPPRANAARFVIAGGTAGARHALAEKVRDAGWVAATVPVRGARPALDYARRWGYGAAVICGSLIRGEGSAQVHRASDGARRRFTVRALERIGRWAGE